MSNLGGKYAVLVDVARCESGFRQYDKDGYVLRGTVNQKDVGLFQINEKYWLDASLKLGYDIYSIDGNIEMAKYIFDTQGIEAWSASEPCWG